jgi:hypothetical protein
MHLTIGTFGTALALFSVAATARPSIVPRLVSVDSVLPAYDYVVIGGGTGGLAVASRLSEDSSSELPSPGGKALGTGI